MDKNIKKSTSFRLPIKTKRLIEIIAQKLGLSQTTVVILAIRQFADEENVEGDNLGE
jgi:predicted transcriptional regulator